MIKFNDVFLDVFLFLFCIIVTRVGYIYSSSARRVFLQKPSRESPVCQPDWRLRGEQPIGWTQHHHHYYHQHHYHYNYHDEYYHSYNKVILALALSYYWSGRDWLWVRAGYTTNCRHTTTTTTTQGKCQTAPTYAIPHSPLFNPL